VADATIPADDLQQTTQLLSADSRLNIHAFSYRHADPMINWRVINDTAASLALVSQLRH
jgi:hypothetical protein